MPRAELAAEAREGRAAAVAAAEKGYAASAARVGRGRPDARIDGAQGRDQLPTPSSRTGTCCEFAMRALPRQVEALAERCGRLEAELGAAGEQLRLAAARLRAARATWGGAGASWRERRRGASSARWCTWPRSRRRAAADAEPGRDARAPRGDRGRGGGGGGGTGQAGAETEAEEGCAVGASEEGLAEAEVRPCARARAAGSTITVAAAPFPAAAESAKLCRELEQCRSSRSLAARLAEAQAGRRGPRGRLCLGCGGERVRDSWN